MLRGKITKKRHTISNLFLYHIVVGAENDVVSFETIIKAKITKKVVILSKNNFAPYASLSA